MMVAILLGSLNIKCLLLGYFKNWVGLVFVELPESTSFIPSHVFVFHIIYVIIEEFRIIFILT